MTHFELRNFGTSEPRNFGTPELRNFAAFAGACTLLLGTALAVSPSSQARFTFTAPHMGTEFRIILHADSESHASAAATAAFARVADLDATLSDYRDDSELTRLGRQAPGEAVRVSDDLFRVLSHAQRIAQASGGAFDPTAGSLTKLWRRARRTGEFPSQQEIDLARETVGFDKLKLDGRAHTVQLARSNIRFDLGGIAKGFAADEARLVLKRHDIHRALIAAGGDILAMGAPPERDTWTVAVAALDSTGREARRLRLRDAAVSTSGDRDQWLEHNGIRYSHIVDPRSGWPIAGTSSVTVVARRGADADALATAVSVLGLEEGLTMIDAFDDAAALVQHMRGGLVESFVSSRWKETRSIPEPALFVRPRSHEVE